MEIKAKFNKKGNVKLGYTMWSFSKLYGDDIYTVDINGIETPISGTCGKHCTGCKASCYVKKSYRYPSVIKSHARNTLAMRTSIEQSFENLYGQIKRARKKPVQIRINQSGELESLKELLMWSRLAETFPDIDFYLYTKAYEIVIPQLKGGKLAANLTVLISIWHEYGIEEYKLVAARDNVKCFVYDDRGYDYKASGIECSTYCKAYDESGKLDHKVTCDKCRKCFNRNSNHKCIGCMAH